MNKIISILLLISLFGCEDIVVIKLPKSKNHLVVEGWITNEFIHHQVKLSLSNGFLSLENNPYITDASIEVIRLSDLTVINFNHISKGIYRSEIAFVGLTGQAYTLHILLPSGEVVTSLWDFLPPKKTIQNIIIDSYEESDPENPRQTIEVLYPKIIVRDSANYQNFYRWKFYKNGEIYSDPSFITIQSDKFFDGNLIPNTFDEFSCQPGDTIIVELQSISKNAYSYLKLLNSQLGTFGESVRTTSATVRGNLTSDSTERTVLGYYGAIAIVKDTLILPSIP